MFPVKIYIRSTPFSLEIIIHGHTQGMIIRKSSEITIHPRIQTSVLRC